MGTFKVEYTNSLGDTETRTVNARCLVKFIDPNKEYPVSYIIQQDGARVNKLTTLKGEDLTEPQILDLFVNELI